MTRREILAAGAVVAGSFALRSGRANPAAGIRFGVRTPLPNVGLRDRALLVKRLGFDGIELGPEWLNQPLEILQQQLEGTGVAVSAIVGSIDLLNIDAEKRAQAIETDRRRLELASALKADCVIEVPVFGPNRFPDLSPVMNAREIEQQLLLAGLRQLAGDIERSGVILLLEPCNRKETHFLNLQVQAARIILRVGSPGIGTLSDFYHMQLEEPNIAATLARYGRYTRYVHLADGENRLEPGRAPVRLSPGFSRAEEVGLLGLAHRRIEIYG